MVKPGEAVMAQIGGWGMMTLKLHQAVLLAASVARQRIGVVPCGNVEPDGGVQTIVTLLQSSMVGGGKFTTAPHWPAAVTPVMSIGQEIFGCTVTVWLATFWQSFVSVPVTV
jgi:hypothetical protein